MVGKYFMVGSILEKIWENGRFSASLRRDLRTNGWASTVLSTAAGLACYFYKRLTSLVSLHFL